MSNKGQEEVTTRCVWCSVIRLSETGGGFGMKPVWCVNKGDDKGSAVVFLYLSIVPVSSLLLITEENIV